jgi:large subunit ribosomal protein L15e
MVKGLAYYLRQAWKKPEVKVLRERMAEWRKSDAVVQVEKPLRLDRARSLGYKAKRGVVVARVRLKRGGHTRPRPIKGRRSKRMHTRKNLKLNYKEIAELRAARKYHNLNVLNSYWIGKDGNNFFFEVILIDPTSPEIKSDKQLSFMTTPANKARVFRGVTSTGAKARGLRNSTIKAPKVRPSLNANKHHGN